MSATHVFLGPSLSRNEARGILPEATFLPPAKAGDVYVAVKNGAQIIGIIDGYFEQVPSVWHKEVLYALSCGVHVFGASSIGALRAAELHPFGMVGLGRIFEAYRDGACEDDDEVAVAHGPEEAGFPVLSEAMVNVRHALSEALRLGIIGPVTHDTVLRAMKHRNYMQRSWLLLPEIAEAEHLPCREVDALIAFVKNERPNLKRLDAVELLMELRRFAQDAPPPFEPNFELEATVFWDQLVASVRAAPGVSRKIPIEAMRSHIGVVEDDAEAIFQGALLLYLIVKEAQRLGLSVEAEEVASVAERFRRSHGLVTAAATEEWLRRNALSELELSALVEVLALVEPVAKHHSRGLDAFLPVELHRRGRFESVAAAIAEKRRALAEFGLAFPSAEDVGTTTSALLGWYETRYRKIEGSLEEHSEARRLSDPTRFVREILAEYICQSYHKSRAVAPDA